MRQPLGDPPEVPASLTGWSPLPSSRIDRADEVAFTVLDTAPVQTVVTVRFDSLGFEEVVYDGAAFTPAFAGSTREAVTGGQRFTLQRGGGWLAAFRLVVRASNAAGEAASPSEGFEVEGILDGEDFRASAQWERPALEDIFRRIRADFRTLPGGESPLFRRSVEYVLAWVLSGLTHGLHGHLQWIADQILPDRCGDAGVLRWAQVLRIPPKDPSTSRGAAEFTAGPGAMIPAGTLLRRDDGQLFRVDASAFPDGGLLRPRLTAVSPGGLGNTPPGSLLQLQSPIAGVATVGEVDREGLQGGRDAEGIEALRSRVLLRLSRPPRGGGPGDYERWTLEVSGVERAWEYPRRMGPGTTVVAFTVAGDDPIPSAAAVEAVQAHLETKAPPTSRVHTIAPRAEALSPRVRIRPDRPEVRAAVVKALRDLLDAEGVPGQRLLVSHIREAISGAAGEDDHDLIFPTEDVTPSPTGLITLGTVRWS